MPGKKIYLPHLCSCAQSIFMYSEVFKRIYSTGDRPNCCSLHAADVHKRQTFVRCLLSYTLHSDCYTRLHVVILRTFNSNKAVNVFMFVCESHLRCPASESSPSGSQIFSSCFSTTKLSSALGEFSLCSLK